VRTITALLPPTKIGNIVVHQGVHIE